MSDRPPACGRFDGPPGSGDSRCGSSNSGGRGASGRRGKEDAVTLRKKKGRRKRRRRGRLQTLFGVGSSMSSASAGLCFSHAARVVDAVGGTEEQDSSVLSDFDVLNDAIQEFFLDSDDDDCDNVAIFHAVKPFLDSSRRAKNSWGGRGRKAAPVQLAHSASSAAIVLPALTLVEAMLAGVGGRRCRRRRGTLLPRDKGLPLAPLCVVLDLDETLVSARHGPVHLRPYVKELLDACHAEGCEVVVWSAGSPSHVNRILRAVAEVSQRRNWYHHVISRHRKWCDDDGEGAKDLSVLGRPLNRVLMLENSPRCVRLQPRHSVLVEDYLHPTAHDDSLRVLADLVRRVVAGLRAASGAADVDVPRLLSVDSALVDILIPSTQPVSKGENISCRGLFYSLKGGFADRSYGGRPPLVVHEES